MSDVNSINLNLDYLTKAMSPMGGSLSSGFSSFDSSGLYGSIFYQPIKPANLSFNLGGFTPNYSFGNYSLPTNFGDMFAANLQQQAWNGILGVLANYKPMTIDLSMLNFNPQSTYSDEDTSYFSYDAKELKDKWQKKAPHLSDGFYNKAVAIAKRLNCDPNDLLAIMYSESGLKPGAVNNSSGATGLIQFIPSTAESLGTTTQALKRMSAEEQLVYVEKYLSKMKKAAGFGASDKIGAGSLYALIFLPARANKEVLASMYESNSYYSANRGLDRNGDGQITKSELAQRVRGYMA